MPLFKEELQVIQPKFPEGIGALFTEREGGVSSGPWGGPEGIMGLNVGSHVSDNASCVRMNREIVSQLTPSPPRWMTQVHGVRVVDAESVQDESVQADAQVCVTPGVVCAVMVADCLPVLVADSKARAVAAIHAGWRGLAGGVIENAVARLKERIADPEAELFAWLGPRIGADNFETGPEVWGAFKDRYGDVDGAVRQKQGGKVLVDLAAYARAALAGSGVSCVDDCGLSTVDEPKRFYSYRRDGEKTGRHAALIWIEPKE